MSDDQASTGGSRNDQIAAATTSDPSVPDGAQEVVITRKIVVTNEVATRTLWKIVGVVVVVLVGFIMLDRARSLVAMLIISMFFSLALVPLVERLHNKRGWKRGAAISGMIRKVNEPITKLIPGLYMKFISRTSLVARAIVSPTGCRL